MEPTTVHNVVQGIIAVLGVVAAILTARKNKWWIPVTLIAQPIWVYSAYRANQWGMMILAVVFMLTTSYAIKFWWVKKIHQNN